MVWKKPDIHKTFLFRAALCILYHSLCWEQHLQRRLYFFSRPELQGLVKIKPITSNRHFSVNDALWWWRLFHLAQSCSLLKHRANIPFAVATNTGPFSITIRQETAPSQMAWESNTRKRRMDQQDPTLTCCLCLCDSHNRTCAFSVTT